MKESYPIGSLFLFKGFEGRDYNISVSEGIEWYRIDRMDNNVLLFELVWKIEKNVN